MIGVVLTPLAKTMWRGPHDAARVPSLALERARPSASAASSQVPPDEFGVRPDVELHRLGVDLEPVRQHVLRDEDRPGSREGHVGQVVDARLVVQRQRVVAVAPAIADPRLAVHHERVDAEQAQPRRDREPRLRGADHQHGGVAVGIGARPVAPVEPVLAAEIALPVDVLPALAVGRVLVSADLVERGHQRPGARRLAAFGDQAHDAIAGTDLGFEGEDRLDRLGARALHAPRRRAAGGEVQSAGRGARQRWAADAPRWRRRRRPCAGSR